MKELLTKKFWHDVKKTFEEAQKDEPPKIEEAQGLLERPSQEVTPADVPPSDAGRES